jgi:hypothetical protein
MPKRRHESSIEHSNAHKFRQKHIEWNSIPTEVKSEIDELSRATGRDGREYSLTMCKKAHKDRLFIGNDFKGNHESTLALDCNARFGKSQRIGSAHSHPSGTDTVGIVPSEADIFSNLADSKDHKHKQIDCITAPNNQFINCYQVNDIPDKRTVKKYEKALAESIENRKTSPVYLDNVPKDFAISLFDKSSGKRDDNPSATSVIKSAFGASNRTLREKVKTMERSSFCEQIADYMGQGHRDDVVLECKKELGRRSILGFIDY